MFEVDRFEHCGLQVRVVVDEDPSSPADWDNFGQLATWHRDYAFGDFHDLHGMLRYKLDEHRGAVVARWFALSNESIVSLPVRVQEGHGPFVSIEEASSWKDANGVIFATKATAEMTGVEPENYLKALREDLKVWSMYAEGDVYGYTVSTPEGEELDSCWEIYGHDYALEEARQAAVYEAHALAERARVEAEESARWANQDVATVKAGA